LAERIQKPFIFLLVMAKDIRIPVVGEQPEATVPDAVPLVQNLHDLKRLGIFCRRTEPKRPLVRLVAGVTFNLENHRHNAPPALKGQFAADGLSVLVGERNGLDGNSGLNQNVLGKN